MPFPFKVKLKNLKHHDRFYEIQRGEKQKWYALENAYRIKEAEKNGWQCTAVSSNGYHTFFEAENPGVYELELFLETQTITEQLKEQGVG